MTNPIPRLLVLARIAAAAAAGAGFFSLVTWGLGQWRLATYGTNYVPMAPVTALLFVLLGLAFVARLQWPGTRAARFACAFAAMLTVAAGGLVLAQAGGNFPLPWDTWLVRAPAAVGAIPVGRMSPLTALTFILSAAALWGQSLRLATRTAVRRSIYLLASAALALGGLVTAGYAAGSPPLYGGTTVPMALLTALAFMSLNAGVLLVGQVDKLLRTWRAEVEAQHISTENGRFTRRLIVSLVAIGGLILLAGLFYLRREQAAARTVIYRQLEAITKLKVNEISTWRNERLGEARFLQQNRLIGRELANFRAAPGDTGQRQLLDWLAPIKGGSRYECIAVFDPQGRTLLAIPAAAGDVRVTPGLLARALAASEPVFGDIEREAGAATLHLDLLVPVASPLPAQPAAPIGVIMLRLDPAQFLYSLIQSWPVPSESAELVLVRRDGDEVVLLNELRHQPSSALTLRHSIHEPRLPSAMAARGETGVHEGIDYRGVAVLSVNHPIPDSPWFLVAKIDLAEAYAPIQRDAWQTGLVVILLLLAVVLAGTSLWRQRHAAYLRHTLIAEREHQAMAERLGLVMQHANDCIFLLDETGRILEANHRATATYGYTLDEFRALPPGGLRSPAAQPEMPRQLDLFRSPDGTVFETVHQRKDGTPFPVEVSGRAVLLDSRQHLLGIYRDISERKRLEADLHRSAELYRLITENTSDIIYLYDLAAARFTFVSPAAERLTGHPHKEIMQQDLTGLLMPDSAAAAGRVLARQLAAVAAGDRGKNYTSGIYDLRHRDGRILTCEIITNFLFADTGRPTHILGVARDVTERSQAEAQLKKLSRVVEQSPTSIVITDLTGAIEYVNPWFCTLTGYTFDEVRGQNPRVLKSGDTPAATYTDMWQTLAAGRTWRGELINRKKNGELYTELAVLAPVFGADGRVTHYVAIKDDITERKRIENTARETLQRFNAELEAEVAQRTRALAESEERRELVLQANAMGTFEIDVATGEGHWNEAEFTLLGLKPGAAPSNAATLFRYVHPEDLGPLMARWEQALHTGEFDTEFRILRADGQERWLAGKGHFAVEGGASGCPARFLGVNYDITDRKRLEAETTALLERERELSVMKTRFISMTSHEFRTPMTAIMGSVELLANHLDQLTPGNRDEIFGRINTSLNRMTTMLDDLLTLNRVDAKRTEVRLTAINLGPFVQNLVHEIQAGDRHGHPFEVHLPPADAPFVTDPNLLHHIVSNLLSNAVRYSPAGTPVTIHVERDAWRLHLSVENHGVGIPAADRARIFEPFERGSNVGHIKGTGLGLNIVKRLTGLLGGHVTLRSPEGGATRFTVALPFLTLPTPPP